MIEAFLFDFHRTLVYSRAWLALEIKTLPRAAFAYLARTGRIPLLDEEQFARAEAVFRAARMRAEETGYETSHVEDLRDMVEALGLRDAVPDRVVEQTVAELHRRCVETAELMDGATRALTDLKGMGYRLGIVSNAAYSPFLTWTLERFGLSGFFELVVVSADVHTRKPWLRIFEITLERMELLPQQVVYVGDDFRKDVQASKELGMRALWFRPDEEPIAAEQRKVADAVISSLKQVPLYGERWRERES